MSFFDENGGLVRDYDYFFEKIFHLGRSNDYCDDLSESEICAGLDHQSYDREERGLPLVRP